MAYFEKHFDAVGEHTVSIAKTNDYTHVASFLKDNHSFFESSKMNILIKDLS
jgi:hypothetical protein